MGRMPWAVYLWPGVPHVWSRGAWSGLVVAVLAAGLLNLALVSSFVWTDLELLRNLSRTQIWLIVAILWIGSAVFSFGCERCRSGEGRKAVAEESFGEALDQYLQQNWYDAERTLNRLLRRNPRDVDARLMLATVLRHTGRVEEAAEQLDRLSRIEGSRKWELEIAQERRWLIQAAQETDQDGADADRECDEERIAA